MLILAVLTVIAITLTVCTCHDVPQQVVDRAGGMAVSPISGHIFTFTCGDGISRTQNLTEWDRQLDVVTVYTELNLINPNNAAADPYDPHIIWIVDNTRRLYVFNTSDSSIKPFAATIPFFSVGDIIRNRVDGDILVTHVTMTGQAQIIRIGLSGDLKAEYNVNTLTGSLAVDNKGFIYLTQSTAVLQLSPDGHIVKNFTTSPPLQGALGLAVTSDFDILVADLYYGHLFQINQAGRVVKIWDRVTPAMNQTGNFTRVTTFQIDIVRVRLDVIVAKDVSVGRVLLIPSSLLSST